MAVGVAMRSGLFVGVGVGEGVAVGRGVAVGVAVAVGAGVGLRVGEATAVGVVVGIGSIIEAGKGKGWSGQVGPTGRNSSAMNCSISVWVRLRWAVSQARLCHDPRSTSHKVTVLSQLPAANSLPSGLKSMLFTVSVSRPNSRLPSC